MAGDYDPRMVFPHICGPGPCVHDIYPNIYGPLLWPIPNPIPGPTDEQIMKSMQETAKNMQTTMRRFNLLRDEDETGISGTGVVAEGVEFWDGTCALRWKTKHRCSATYDSVLTLEAIHGHGGKTKIVWIDQ